MGFALRIELVGDSYDAAWGGLGEWPPHPARLFCALVSVAEPGSADDEALRWLEAQAPPAVFAPAARSAVLEAFVPTNAPASAGGGHQTYLGRTSAARRWARCLPDGRAAVMEWEAAPPEVIAARLEALARRVPYLGRATSPVLLTASPADGGGEAPRAGDTALERYAHAEGGTLRLRVPYPGYLASLRGAYEHSQPAWIVEHAAAYHRGDPEPLPEQEPVDAGAYPDLVILGFPPGHSLDGRHTVALTSAFKAALLERLGHPHSTDPWAAFAEEELALINGHHDGRGRQSCVLALPYVGVAHASGELLGVGFCPSPDLTPHLRRAVLRLLGLDAGDGSPRLRILRVPGLRHSLRLLPADQRWSLSADRWTGPARRWLSALPVVLDWFPRRNRPAEELVARGCEVAGLPRPSAVEILPASAVQGTPLLRQMDTLRRPGDTARPLAHVALTFPRMLSGPVVIGHLRHLGLGLCVPEGS